MIHLGNCYVTLRECADGDWLLEVSIQYWTLASIRLSRRDAKAIARELSYVESKLRRSA